MKVTIYNEENYLKGNPEALERFSKVYQDREKIWDTERTVYADTITKYNYFLKRSISCKLTPISLEIVLHFAHNKK